LTITERYTGESDSDSNIAPYIGGGYLSWQNNKYFYNIGVFFSLGSKLTPATSGASEESTGIDPQVIIGLAF